MFGWAGAGAGASDALTQILAQKRAAFLQQQQLQQQAEAAKRAQAQLEIQQSQETRLGRQAQLGEAELTLGHLDAQGQGVSVPQQAIEAMQGTPAAARLDPKRTLAGVSRVGDPSVGMQTQALPQQDYTTLRPTQAQMQADGQKAAQGKLVEGLRPRNPLLAQGIEAGMDPGQALSAEMTGERQRETAQFTADRQREQAELTAQRQRELAGVQHHLAVSRDERASRRVATQEDRLTQKDLLALYRDAHTRAAADYRARAAQTLDGTVTDESGNPITPDQLAEEYIQSTLAALEALEAANAPAQGSGRKVIQGLRLRLAPGTRLPTSAQDPQIGAALQSLPRAPQSGQTVTRAELAATAQRMGISIEQAETEARTRGMTVR